MSWTDERVELLKKLWSDGLSASQIAARMGDVTRNAVIGKVHRLGLSGRARPARSPRPRVSKPRMPQHPSPSPGFNVRGNVALKPTPKVEPEPEAEPEPAPAPIQAVDLPSGERVTILNLTEKTCKWPIGDPTDADFHFCGRQSMTGLPYCKAHAEVAYQPMQDRRKKKKAAGG